MDSDLLESVDEVTSDALYPQNGASKKLSKGNSPNGAHVFGNSASKDSQLSSTVKPGPHSSTSGSPIQNQLLFLKLLQESGKHQVLTQRLGQLQMHKQQLIQQRNQLSKSTGQGNGVMGAAAQQQNQAIAHKLTTISQMINQINQQLMILSQLSSQQRDIGKNSEVGNTSVSSPKPLHNPAPLGPMRLKNDQKGNSSFSRSQSANAVISLSMEPSRSLAYGMQGLSLNSPVQSSVSQSSARSMSRLQQIISGSSSNDSLVSASIIDESAFQSSVPMTPDSHSSAFTTPASLQASTALQFSSPQSGSLGLSSDSRLLGSAVSAPFTNKKLVSDIQEFKPGVPWQPKSQIMEPTQVFPKEAAISTTSNYHNGTVYTQPPGLQQPLFVSNAQLMRSQSVSGSSYNSAVGPQNKCNPNSAQGVGYEKQFRVGHRPYTHSHCPPKPSAPPDMLNLGSSWKPKGRTIVPPSSLYPTSDLQYKPGFGMRKHHRLANVPQPQYRTATDQRSWRSSYAMDASSSSSSSMISHTVWGSDPSSVGTPEDQQQQGWVQGYTQGSHNWIDARSNQSQHPPHTSFTSPQPQTSPPESYTPTSVDSLTSSGSTWGQDELNSLNAKQGMVSPEPTFAEWQAGKKARLSVTKGPLNPPSQWLIVRNVNTQVSTLKLSNF